MGKINVQKPTREQLESWGVFSWPIWEKGVSQFDWHYDCDEKCFLLDGKAQVTAEGKTTEFEQGDFVSFPKGLSCQWNILEPVRKHYQLGGY